MLRSIKYGVAAVVATALCGFFLIGPGFLSYVRTSARSVRETVKDSVPVEFELRRARDLIEAILPELQAQVRMIAKEEVEIAKLDADVSASSQRLAGELARLTQLRNQLRNQTVSLESDGRNWTREQYTQQLAGRFERYKTGAFALNSKQRLLEKRNESLSAALSSLDSMRHRKAELEQKVEALAAQARLVQASKFATGIRVDGNQLSEADHLLQQIETRLAVAQRVLEHEQDTFTLDFSERAMSEEQMLEEFDAYFNADENAPAIVTASTMH
jgi:septal ring factor EnvC (AmiA/AmiB activator)